MQHEKLLEAWLAQYEGMTVFAYRPVAQKFLAEVALEASAIQTWADTLPGKPATVARKVNTIASLLIFAFRQGYLETDLALDLRRPLLSSKKVQSVDVSNLPKLLECADSKRDRLLIRVLYELSLSPPEAVELLFKDLLDIVPLTEEVRAFQGGADSDRLVFLSYRNKKLTARDARRIVQAVAKEAGVKVDSAWLRVARHWKDPNLTRTWNVRTPEGPFGIVYGLSDPRTGALCYIGMTRQRLEKRIVGHMSTYNLNTRTRAAGWLRRLAADGVRPVGVVLATAKDRDELLYLERYHISQARSEGHPLVNSTHVWSLRKIQKRLRGDMSRCK